MLRMLVVLQLLLLLSAVAAFLPQNVTIIHFGNVRGYITSTDARGVECDPTTNANCLGGHSRRKAFVDSVRSRYQNVIVLDSGNTFYGSQFYR